MILRQRSKPLRSALESVYQKEVPQRRGRAGGWSKGRRSCSKKDGCSQGTFSFSPNIWAFLLGGVRLTALWHGWGKAVDSSGDGSSEAWARAAEVLLRASVDTRRLLELEQHLLLFFSTPFLFVPSWPFLAGSACHLRSESNSRQPAPLPHLAALLASHWPAGWPGLIPAKVRILKMSPFVNLRFSRI